jgi:hypothetical protein
MSRRFILQARDEIEQGHRLQAGEKAWAAAAQHLKIIGERRGWDHDSHRQLENIGRQIVTEFEEPELANALAQAYKGHQNLYENQRSLREIGEIVEAVEEVMPLLESLDLQDPRPFVITSNQQLRRLVQLTGNRDLRIGDTSPVGFSLRHPESPNGGGR